MTYFFLLFQRLKSNYLTIQMMKFLWLPMILILPKRFYFSPHFMNGKILLLGWEIYLLLRYIFWITYFFFQLFAYTYYLPKCYLFLQNRCPVTNCFLTDNKTLLGPRSLNQFDALIFHPRDMEPEKNGYFQIPNQKKRLAHQRYVMFMVESSTHDHLEYHKFPHFFNWTMTFRRDSDFYR